MRFDVGLATCRQLPEDDFDAAPLQRALEASGLRSAEVAWDDELVDWTQFGAVVLRSTWNYYLHHSRFLSWIERLADKTRVFNPPAVVRWNTHKGYLVELAESGIATVPTVLVRRGEARTLASICEQRGWSDVVVKPAVSAASYLTFALSLDDEKAECQFADQVRERDTLVQPFVDSVRTHGERALVTIDGHLSHAVRKNPRFGDDDEAITGPMEISPAESALASAALDALPIAHDTPLLYARVDMAPDPAGTPMIMELELAEPSLFFEYGPGSAARMASGIAQRLGS